MKKPALLAIHLQSEPEPGEEESSEYELSPEQLMAGKQAMKAIKMGDAKAFTLAMCALMESHSEPDGDEDIEEDLKDKEY